MFDHAKEIDKLLSSLRAFVIEAYLCEGNEKDALFEKDIGREAILPFLKKQATFANKEHPFGYAVLDGTGINKSLIKTYELKIGDSVVLASDGYPKLCKTLKDSEECLKNALLSDPLSINENRQTKMKSKKNASFDDRAYLSFTVQ